MKTLIKYICAGACLLGMNGCKDNNGTDSNPEGFITLDSQIAQAEDRISNNNFEAGDAVGLYVVPYQADNTTPGDIATSDYASNVRMTFDGSNWLTDSGGKIAWPGPSRRADIYSYYPYTASIADPTDYLFTVQRDQSTEAGYQASDFLLASRTGLSPTTADVTLTYFHKMSKVILHVVSQIGELNEEIAGAAVMLTDVLPQALIDFSDGSVTASPAAAATEITPYTFEEPIEGFDLSAEAIVAPQTISSGSQLIRIQTADARYYYRPVNDITFEPGKTVTFYITITQQGINVSVNYINEWLDGGTTDGTIGDPAPRVVDISGLDWAASRVYNIYSRGNRIGQACREYLFLNNVVDAQAIVIYPQSTDGTIDFTQGFVAQVMNRTRSSVDQEYYPNTADVHGGYVSFGTANTLTSYTPGTLPLVTKVQIVSADDIVAAPDNSIALLTTEPDQLTDIDGNSYPIVKIATRYWMAKNLTVEHFSDGSELPAYYYNNDPETYKELFGAYYLWNTIQDPRGIAPEGWHVPDYEEMYDLYRYLNPDTGRKLKANILWTNLNYNDDVTGFRGLPAGRRLPGGTFNETYSYGQWWTSTEYSSTYGWRFYLDFGNNAIHPATLEKTYTQSVRLVRD